MTGALLELAIVIPTFNEKGNVATLIAKLDQALVGRRWEAIFVDDDSPDGTADAARAIARLDTRVEGRQRCAPADAPRDLDLELRAAPEGRRRHPDEDVARSEADRDPVGVAEHDGVVDRQAARFRHRAAGRRPRPW